MLYHGSKTSHITKLKPSSHSLINNESVVFATNDIRFALAMIHGTSKEVDVGHIVNQDTGEEKMYMKEMIPNAFDIILKPGILYTLEDSGFINDIRLSRSELISKKETNVLEEKYHENIFEELKKFDINFIYKVL